MSADPQSLDRLGAIGGIDSIGARAPRQAWERFDQAIAETVRAMLQGFDGSDVRLPDPAASLPGDRASAAPDANDLNGEVLEWSPQALAAQRYAAGALQSGPAAWQTAPVHDSLFDHPIDSASAVDAGSAASPTQSAAIAMPQAAALFGGDVRDGQAGDVLGGRIFNVTQRQRDR